MEDWVLGNYITEKLFKFGGGRSSLRTETRGLGRVVWASGTEGVKKLIGSGCGLRGSGQMAVLKQGSWGRLWRVS